MTEKIKWQQDILNDSHTLIAGCSGSGKSVAERAILTEVIRKSPVSAKLVLIDLKQVELIDFKDAPHTWLYVDKPEEVAGCLYTVMQMVETRYEVMQKNHEKMSRAADIYVVIDEYADLVLTCSKQVIDTIQRISQIGRAARVHLIISTQRPTKEVIKGATVVNLETRLALRTVSKQDSRNILGVNGAEELPQYGYGIFQRKGYNARISIDLVPDEEIKRLIDYWNGVSPKRTVSLECHSEPRNEDDELLPDAEEWKRVISVIGKALMQ